MQPTRAAIVSLVSRSWQISPLAAASGLSILNSVAIAVAFAHLAGPAPYGIYQLTFAVVSVVGILSLAGSSTAATRAAAQGRQAAWPLFRARLPFALATSAVIGGAALALALLERGPIAPALGAAAATLPLFLGADVYPAQMIGQRRFGHYLAFQTAVQALTALGVVITVSVAPDEPWLAVGATAAITGGAQFVGLLRSRRSSFAGPEDLAYARRLSGIAVLSAIDARFDILVVGSLLGAREAGLVAVARTLPTVVKRIWEVLYQPFFVKMAAESPEESFRIAQRYRLPLMLVLGGASAVGAASAPWLIPAVFGEAFEAAVLVTQLLLAANIVVVVGYLDEVFLKSQGDLRRMAVIYVALPVVSFVALPPLVYAFGITGVGVEALLVALVYVVSATRLSRASATSFAS